MGSVKKVRNCIGAADRGKYRRAAGAITAMNETGSDIVGENNIVIRLA